LDWVIGIHLPTDKPRSKQLKIFAGVVEFLAIVYLVVTFLYVEGRLDYSGTNSDSTVQVFSALIFIVPFVVIVLLLIIFKSCFNLHPTNFEMFKFFSHAISLNTLYPYYPDYLYVSDGGHLENFGFLPLIRRQCSLIVIADGSQDVSEGCQSLLLSIQMAEQRLHCSFYTENQKSIALAINTEFAGRRKQRIFKFKVRYVDGTIGDVVYLKARREFDVWHGLCCDCCKGFSICSSILGNFPQHSTANQFFSPGLYELYQTEGHRAYEDFKKSNNVQDGTIVTTASDVV